MTALPSGKMTVDQFLAWAEGQSRLELHAGHVVKMAAERVGHARVKFALQRALEDGIQRANVACFVIPDGVTVRIDSDTCYEPDAMVFCGTHLDPDALEVNDPVILVEVLSPSTQHIDVGRKLTGYFSLPSVVHYLIVDPEQPPVVHHHRRPDGTILTSIVPSGRILLDPPGIDIDVASFFS
jgi:Uma2 family endonuclease